MTKVAVVILNWNGVNLLKQYLPSVIEHSQNAEIIIADNGSTDDSISFLESHYPNIRIIDNHDNLGFTGGYNTALKQVDAEYYVLLNSDIEVTDNWIEPIIHLMESDEKIAVCQPKLLSYLEKDKFEYAGASGGYIDSLGYPFCRGRIFDTLENDNGQYNDSRECFWATGAAMFVRADVYHRFGGLDEEFFAHQEEIDFCWRVKNEGYKVYVCPDSVVYHLGGGTLNKTSPHKTYLNFRNNLYLLYKNLPKHKYKRVFIIRLFMDILASFVFLLQGKQGEFNAVYKAYKDFFKRRKYLNRTNHNNINISSIYKGSIVYDNHIKGIKKFNQFKDIS